MKVFDLVCDEGHRFEGWFASSDAYATQRDAQVVACPLCESTEVHREPSAPRLNLSAGASTEGASPDVSTATPVANAQVARRFLDHLREVVAQTEDVGARFAEEARRIHYAETPARAIRGTASDEEQSALREEGIETIRLPLPRALTETLQ